MRVRVVTDSTSDLPPEVARDLGITVVPAQIQFGEQVFLDGVELTSDEFYRRLQSSPVLPKTSPASISTFQSVYRRLAEEADAIISIHVVARLSVTYDIARQASADLKCPIAVVDSQTASMACGLLAIIAAKAARAGESLKEHRGSGAAGYTPHRHLRRVWDAGVPGQGRPHRQGPGFPGDAAQDKPHTGDQDERGGAGGESAHARPRGGENVRNRARPRTS